MLLEEWLRCSAGPLAGSVVVVAISLAVRLLAHRLQVADPGSPPIAALRLFDVNSERNVPTAWSVALLLSAVALAGSLAVVEDRSRAGGWALVTLVSAALALDEWFALHERLGPGRGRGRRRPALRRWCPARSSPASSGWCC